MRLDQYLSHTYNFTRNKSQQLIKNGLISLCGKIITKSAYEINTGDIIEIKKDKSIAWVSRSAGKLDGFFEEIHTKWIDIRIAEKTCLDIGSSTGGFTQILLERWAMHVDAVDVGTNQLHPSIRTNPKVSTYENMDIRKFSSQVYGVITIDVSFISLHEIIPELDRLSSLHTEIFVLFKPQFEVGRENLRKTGVPKDEKSVIKALENFQKILSRECYVTIYTSKASVIGEAGNQEYMFFLMKNEKYTWHIEENI